MWTRAAFSHRWIGVAFTAGRGRAVTNFQRTLPAPQSELAQKLLKDPYNFDFLTLGTEMLERDWERGLIDHLRDLILELDKGFAFVGNQYHLEIGRQDYFLDLLFYPLRLRCYVVIDLKIEEFQPEFAGKTNFYLSAVDDLLRHVDDTPSIGLILYEEKNRIVVEYALRDTGHCEQRSTNRCPLCGPHGTLERSERGPLIFSFCRDQCTFLSLTVISFGPFDPRRDSTYFSSSISKPFSLESLLVRKV